jgi:hypothetical protein
LHHAGTFVSESHLAVDDSFAGGYPLNLAGDECSGAAEVVAVFEHSVEDGGDGL